MKLQKRHGTGTFNLPDPLAQRLVSRGGYIPADYEAPVAVKKEDEKQKPAAKKTGSKKAKK